MLSRRVPRNTQLSGCGLRFFLTRSRFVIALTPGNMRDDRAMVNVRFDTQAQRCETKSDQRCAGDQSHGRLAERVVRRIVRGKVNSGG